MFRIYYWLGGTVILLAGLAGLAVFVVWPLLFPPSAPKQEYVGVEDPKANEKVPVPTVLFKDITEAALGKNRVFIHNNGSTGQKLLPETMGSGVAFIDYNNDGL